MTSPAPPRLAYGPPALATRPFVLSPRTARSQAQGNPSRGLAGEVSGVVGAAGTPIHRRLRIRTERAGHINPVVENASREDHIRRDVRLPPPLEDGEHVELIGALPAAAVRHAGDHEQTQPVALIPAHFLQHAFVV